MKRVKLEFGRELLEKMGMADLMKDIHRMEGMAVLKLTPEEYVEVWKVRTSIDLKEVAGRFGIAEVIVLREERDEVICLVKGRSGFLAELLRRFDVYYEYPVIYEEGKTAFSIIGEKDQIKRLLKFFENNGIPHRMLSASNYALKRDLLGLLTPRQKRGPRGRRQSRILRNPPQKNGQRNSNRARNQTHHLPRAPEKSPEKTPRIRSLKT